MRRWLGGATLAGSALLAACGGDATSPSYSLDLAEIGRTPVAQWLQVPDSARVGEPFVVTTYATNRGCETPGGLSVTQMDGRVRIVGAVKVASGDERVCPTPGAWSQSTTLTATVEGDRGADRPHRRSHRLHLACRTGDPSQGASGITRGHGVCASGAKRRRLRPVESGPSEYKDPHEVV
jgi:hypothetical protein